jgi:hypothetical protein
MLPRPLLEIRQPVGRAYSLSLSNDWPMLRVITASSTPGRKTSLAGVEVSLPLFMEWKAFQYLRQGAFLTRFHLGFAHFSHVLIRFSDGFNLQSEVVTGQTGTPISARAAGLALRHSWPGGKGGTMTDGWCYPRSRHLSVLAGCGRPRWRRWSALGGRTPHSRACGLAG